MTTAQRTLWALLAVAPLAGCSEPVPRTQPSIYMIPAEAKLVGGGTHIHFAAPESGVALLYDWDLSRVILSKSLRKGEQIWIRNGVAEDEHGVVVLGSGEYREDMGLYFVSDRELKLGEEPPKVGGGAESK